MGAYPAALSSIADKAYGIAGGYQMFFSNKRRQLLIEAGARQADDVSSTLGLATRFQQAIGRRFVFLLDGYLASNADTNSRFGLSAEILVKF